MDRASSHRTLKSAVVGLAVAGAIVAALVEQTGSSAQSADTIPQGDRLPGVGAPGPMVSAPGPVVGVPDAPVSAADGVLPDGVTAFGDEYPGVANLDADLLGAIREAAVDAADDGIEFSVNSGWRSARYQDQLLEQAVAEYGSEAEALRWVATSDTSAHVAGQAVDIGPHDATAWLSENGADYGLCPTYRNEPWHYELRPAAIGAGCPPMYDDPTDDPRLQQ